MAESNEPKFPCFARINPIPTRFIMATMGSLAIVNAYLMRQCLSPAITQLVVPRNYSMEDIKKNAVCEADEEFNTGKANSGTRDWSQFLQGFVLSAFYIGYLITHIPGGLLADRYGSKWVLCLGIGSTALFTLLTPLAIEIGDAYALIGLRILMGAGEGTTFPALSVLMADWVPAEERGVLGSMVMGGGQVGSIISNALSGWMLQNYDWPVVFYVWGIVAIVWFIFYVIFCYSFPHTHPCIRQKEKEFLIEKIGDPSIKRKSLPPTPFRAILTGIPMWALIAAQIGHDWAFYIIIAYLPKYMNDVLQMNIKNNGLLSALPSFIMWVVSILSGIIADILIRNTNLGITKVRKILTGIAAFGPAIFLIAASYSGCNRFIVILNFCICMALMGTYYGGMKLTPMDMSPNYAGVIMAITNGIGSATGFVAPTTVGWLTPNTTLQEWRLVFWLAFAILVITGCIYCIWADCEVQPWNSPEDSKKEESKKEESKKEEGKAK